MKFITALAIYYMLWSHHFAETCGFLQQSGTYQFRKLFGYSFAIPAQESESNPMDLPFLFAAGHFFREQCLTLNPVMR